MSQDTTRIVLYSHDALGLGHLRRNLALCIMHCVRRYAPFAPRIKRKFKLKRIEWTIN